MTRFDLIVSTDPGYSNFVSHICLIFTLLFYLSKQKEVLVSRLPLLYIIQDLNTVNIGNVQNIMSAVKLIWSEGPFLNATNFYHIYEKYSIAEKRYSPSPKWQHPDFFSLQSKLLMHHKGQQFLTAALCLAVPQFSLYANQNDSVLVSDGGRHQFPSQPTIMVSSLYDMLPNQTMTQFHTLFKMAPWLSLHLLLSKAKWSLEAVPCSFSLFALRARLGAESWWMRLTGTTLYWLIQASKCFEGFFFCSTCSHPER